MANIKLTKAWTALDVTTGTIQNMSMAYNLEVSEDNTVGSGQILFPRNGFSFDGVQLYARVVAEDDTEVEARVSPFVESAGSGSGSGSGGGTVIPYVLPTATSSVKGGVMVGDGLKINNASLAVDTGTTAGKIVKIEADGKIDSSILPAIAIGNTFVETSEADMLALTATVGDVCVRNDEHQSYILQTAPASVKANWIKLETPASDVTSVNGKTGAVTITLPTKVSELANDANYLTSVPKATKTSAGTVIIGDGIDVDSTGKISVTASGGSYTLPAATTTDLGGVKVGQNLEIDTNGILKSKHPTVTMGTNTTSTETVASGGSFTAIDGITKDTNGHVTAVNTKTVTIPTLPVQATDTTAGVAKLYAATGTNTDGAMTQKAVGDNYYPLTGGTLKGYTINRDVSDNHLVLCGGKNNNDGGAVLLFGKDSEDTRKGGFIVRAHSDVAEWNLSGDTAGNLTWGNKKVAVGDFLPLAGGTMTGAIESKNTALQNTTSNYLRIQQSATLQQGAVLDFYGRDDTHGGRVVIACGTPDGSSYKSLVVSGNGSLTFDNKNVAVGDFLPLSGGKMSGDIAKDVNTKVLTLSGSVDGGHGARLDLVGESYTVDANVQGCFGLHSIKSGKDHALIGYPDGRLTWDGNSLAIGAIKRLTPTEVNSYADSGGHNSNDAWVKAVFSDMPAGATWLAYNSAGEEWSYIFSKAPTGTYGNIFRTSHQGKIQVKGVSDGIVLTKWKECTTTELTY